MTNATQKTQGPTPESLLDMGKRREYEMIHVLSGVPASNQALYAAAPELLTLAMRIKAATPEDWARPSFVEAVQQASANLIAKAEA